jgi:hypothetical protein
MDNSQKRSVTIVDVGGYLTTNNIKVNTTGGDTIAGQNQLVLNANYSSIQLVSNTNNVWFIV